MDDSILFISSNVGSLFENESKSIIESWKDILKKHICEKSPAVVIISLQEFAGKQVVPWAQSERFLEDVYEHFKPEYPKCFSICDCDFEKEEYFTALCTLIFIRQDFDSIKIFDFEINEYRTIEYGLYVQQSSSSNQKSIKIKFDIHLFPNNKWSRKGYMINRIKINECVFDVVNLHLIHDLNFHTLIETPKIYQNYRSMQLKAILKKLDEINSTKTILCGDFNFRTSILEMIQNYDPKYTVEREIKCRSTESLLHVRGANSEHTIASLSAHDINLMEGLLPLDEVRMKRHKKFDKELQDFEDTLIELPINFMPTYCFAIDSEPNNYNNRRCPSWCDRIVFKGEMIPIVENNKCKVIYESFAQDLIVGDHKVRKLCNLADFTSYSYRFI